MLDDFPVYTPIDGAPVSPTNVREGAGGWVTPTAPDTDWAHDRGGGHKTEMTHSEQITDSSSLNMSFDDHLFHLHGTRSQFLPAGGPGKTATTLPIQNETPKSTVGWNIVASGGRSASRDALLVLCPGGHFEGLEATLRAQRQQLGLDGLQAFLEGSQPLTLRLGRVPSSIRAAREAWQRSQGIPLAMMMAQVHTCAR